MVFFLKVLINIVVIINLLNVGVVIVFISDYVMWGVNLYLL